MFSEVLKDLDSASLTLDSIDILCKVCCRPYKICTCAKSCIGEFGVGIYYEIVVTTDGKITTGWGETNELGEGLGVTEIFYINLLINFISIFHLFSFCPLQKLQIDCLYLTLLFDPNNFPIIICSHRSFLANLENHSSLIKPQCHIITLWECMDSPNSLQTIIESSL